MMEIVWKRGDAPSTSKLRYFNGASGTPTNSWSPAVAPGCNLIKIASIVKLWPNKVKQMVGDCCPSSALGDTCEAENID